MFRKNSQIHIGQASHSKIKGVDNSTTSQISKHVYSTHTHLHEADTESQDSLTPTNFEVIPPINPQLKTISKHFAPDLDKLCIEFKSKINKIKCCAYQLKYNSNQQSIITRKWNKFMT